MIVSVEVIQEFVFQAHKQVKLFWGIKSFVEEQILYNTQCTVKRKCLILNIIQKLFHCKRFSVNLAMAPLKLELAAGFSDIVLAIVNILFFITMKLIRILKLTCLKNKH